MIRVADDSVDTEPKLDHLVVRRKLEQVGIGRVAGNGLTCNKSPPPPQEFYPPVQAGFGTGTSRDPRLVIVCAVFGKLERPQPRAAVAVDDTHKRARLRLFDPTAHLFTDDKMLLIDDALGLVRVDLCAAAVTEIRMQPKKVLRSAYRDGVVACVGYSVTDLRVEPQRVKVTGVIRRRGLLISFI